MAGMAVDEDGAGAGSEPRGGSGEQWHILSPMNNRMAFRIFLSCLVALCAVGGVAGCGGSATGDKPTAAERAKTSEEAAEERTKTSEEAAEERAHNSEEASKKSEEASEEAAKKSEEAKEASEEAKKAVEEH